MLQTDILVLHPKKIQLLYAAVKEGRQQTGTNGWLLYKAVGNLPAKCCEVVTVKRHCAVQHRVQKYTETPTVGLKASHRMIQTKQDPIHRSRRWNIRLSFRIYRPPSVFWHCSLGHRKGIQPAKESCTSNLQRFSLEDLWGTWNLENCPWYAG